MRFNTIATRVIETFFPNHCPICDTRLTQGQHDFCSLCNLLLPILDSACAVCAQPLIYTEVCGSCQQQRPYFNRSIIPFIYSPPITTLIYRYKFSAELALAKNFSHAILKQVKRQQAPYPDILIPVPLHRKRLHERGFNQASLLARTLAKSLQIPATNNFIHRNRYTQPQRGQDEVARKRNVRGAFTLNVTQCEYQHIGLVDDVVTSASTVNSISRILKRAGCQTITVFAIAKTDYDQ